MKTILNMKAIEACALCASTEVSRPAMNGVHVVVKNNQAKYVATNGHIMFEHKCETMGQDIDIIIPNETCKQLKSMIKAVDGNYCNSEYGLTIEHDNQHTIERNGTPFLPFKPVDGTYPDTDRIKPSIDEKGGGAVESMGLNPQYITVFHKAFNALRGYAPSAPLGIKIVFSGSQAPMEIRANSTDEGGETLAILMPMRVKIST